MTDDCGRLQISFVTLGRGYRQLRHQFDCKEFKPVHSNKNASILLHK